jgi:hypothetical protein
MTSFIKQVEQVPWDPLISTKPELADGGPEGQDLDMELRS